MQTLRQLARYNAWANQRVFDACAALTAGRLAEVERGTYGSVGETLAHLVGVEDVYLLMLQGRDLSESVGDGSYSAHDTTWFAKRSDDLGAEYQALLAAHDEQWLEERFVVPWFGFALSHRDGLLQVWMHSAQHCAQILSALGAHGIEVPDVDYIFMLSLDQDAAND